MSTTKDSKIFSTGAQENSTSPVYSGTRLQTMETADSSYEETVFSNPEEEYPAEWDESPCEWEDYPDHWLRYTPESGGKPEYWEKPLRLIKKQNSCKDSPIDGPYFIVKGKLSSLVPDGKGSFTLRTVNPELISLLVKQSGKSLPEEY